MLKLLDLKAAHINTANLITKGGSLGNNFNSMDNTDPNPTSGTEQLEPLSLGNKPYYD